MDTMATTKPLGQPIEGEDRDAIVVCPVHGSFGLYFYTVVRNDFCLSCERRKAKAGDRDAAKRLDRLDLLRQRAKREAVSGLPHVPRYGQKW